MCDQFVPKSRATREDYEQRCEVSTYEVTMRLLILIEGYIYVSNFISRFEKSLTRTQQNLLREQTFTISKVGFVRKQIAKRSAPYAVPEAFSSRAIVVRALTHSSSSVNLVFTMLYRTGTEPASLIGSDSLLYRESVFGGFSPVFFNANRHSSLRPLRNHVRNRPRYFRHRLQGLAQANRKADRYQSPFPGGRAGEHRLPAVQA